jgi:hypothetical protein
LLCSRCKVARFGGLKSPKHGSPGLVVFSHQGRGIHPQPRATPLGVRGSQRFSTLKWHYNNRPFALFFPSGQMLLPSTDPGGCPGLCLAYRARRRRREMPVAWNLSNGEARRGDMCIASRHAAPNGAWNFSYLTGRAINVTHLRCYLHCRHSAVYVKHILALGCGCAFTARKSHPCNTA